VQDRDRLYWETPSIPFQPFCRVEGNWGDIRPIRGVKVSRRFLEEAAKSLSKRGATMHLAYENWNNNFAPPPNPVLITPEQFKDSSTMIWVTRDAVNALAGFKPGDNEENGAPSLYCKDVEGKVKEF
jgi:hypothetical protein